MLAKLIGSVRRNHALEHATIAVLASKMGRELRVVGRATRSGFYLYGNLPSDRAPARQCGLSRLRAHGGLEQHSGGSTPGTNTKHDPTPTLIPGGGSV